MNEHLITVAMRDLKSGKCACLRDKRPGDFLCFGCYGPLPRQMKHELHKGIAAGGAEAYHKVKQWLRENTERFLNAPKED
jgi:hypothetical protein